MIVLRLEGVPRDDVDSDAQEVFKILEQADVIKKGGAWLKVHKQVQPQSLTTMSAPARSPK